MDQNLPEFQFNDAWSGSAEILATIERELGTKLPEDYVAFMQKHDGGEGFVGENYLHLWRLGELVQFNRDYEFPVYAPSLFAFGSNGGGEAFAFQRSEGLPIVEVPFIGMSDRDAIKVADSLDGLIARMKSAEPLF